MSTDKIIKAMRQLIVSIIKAMARLARINLLTLAYHQIGILKYESYDKSGEKYLAQTILKKLLPNTQKLVFFDVGANVGNTSILLRDVFPTAEIWAFEPNKFTYNELVKVVSGKEIRCFNVGFGNTCKTELLYIPTSNHISSSASTHKELFHDFYKTADIEEISFEMQTINTFCLDQNITLIDFIKIDTEGFELFVLEGASKMLSEGRVRIIQFEFGECHVFSRTFMLDFYKLLTEFQFFRLDTRRLIPLGDYSVANEIFRFQNIVAIHRDIVMDGKE
jgi:FkbM family methyltransferase